MNIDIGHIEKTLRKLKQKDPALFQVLKKKIIQISRLDVGEIKHFKNLKYGLSEYKRVHVGKSFVLLFKIEDDTIIFVDFDHHDNVYG
jgi:YafQ family addiction module toxin component